MSQNNEFDDKLRDLLNGHSVPPSPHLWNNIQAALKEGETKKPIAGWISWTAPIVIGVLVGLGFRMLSPSIYFSKDVASSATTENNRSAQVSVAINGNEVLTMNQTGNEHLASMVQEQSLDEDLKNEEAYDAKYIQQTKKSSIVNNNQVAALKKGSDAELNELAEIKIFRKNRAKSLSTISDDETLEKGKKVRTRTSLKAKIKKLFSKKGKATKKALVASVYQIEDVDSSQSTSGNAVEYVNPLPVIGEVDHADSILAKKVQAILDTAKSAKAVTAAVNSTIKKERKPLNLGVEVYFNSRATFNTITLGNNATYYATEGKEANSITNRLSYELGVRLTKDIAPHLSIYLGGSMSLLNSGFMYKANNYVAAQTPVFVNGNGTNNSYTTVSPFTNKSVSVSSTYVGLQLGTYLYPDASKRFRFGANMSYYASLNNTIEISEDNANTFSSSNKQATIGLGISAGYCVSLTSNTCLWIEPNAQIFLRKNSTTDGLANFQPHTIGLNFIFQHIK